MKKILMLLCLMVFGICSTACGGLRLELRETSKRTVLGIERLEEREVAALLQNKRIGVFTNQSGIDSKLRSSVDLLRERFNVTAVFVPEHGLLGAVAAGEKFEDSTYEGIKVFSLYGASRRPSKEMLDTVDAIAVDIQDVGVRHYTYTSSLAYIMEECARNKKQVIVFDRPNPLGGAMQGPVLKEEFKSFIGLYELPLRHGLTLGEFARYINAKETINCELEVVALKNWQRKMLWQDTKLPWVQTSPLIPTAETAFLYAATGVAGDTPLSVGVGTAKPFHFIGAPFAEAAKVTETFRSLNVPDVAFRKAAFTPRYGVYEGELVQGAEIYISDFRNINLAELDYLMVYNMQTLYPEQMHAMPKRYGNKGHKVNIALGEASLLEHEPPEKVFPRWQEECKLFAKAVQPYLLYK